MKTLIIVDRKGWAYDRIAQAIQKTYPVDILPVKGGVNKIKKHYKEYDRFLVMGWQCYEHVKFLPKSETLTGVHGHHAWDDRLTTPEKNVQPPQWLIDFLSSFKGYNVVSKRLHNLFPGSVYTPNGADTDIFKMIVVPEGRVVGCAYNPKHDWRKGVDDYIRPACEKAGVRLRLASKDVPYDEMAVYYNLIDIYVCASSSEGMSMSVLEAMACGRPVISTWPSELPTHNVERSVDAIAEALGKKLEVPDFKYSWKEQTPAWINFLKS